MRFGYLFFGYIWLFVCKGIELYPDVLPDIIPNVVGYTLMLYALMRLDGHGKNFRSARNILHLLIMFVMFTDLYKIYNFTTTGTDSEFVGVVVMAVKIVTMIISVAYHHYLFKGIRLLAIDVNIPSLAKSTKLNFRLLCLTNILFIISQLKLFGEYNNIVGLVQVLVNLAWLIMTCVMVYRCYMWICLEGEEDMSKQDKSRRKR
jgi:hypothetical protein